jgi:TRAP transporter TAXI family solute receptor
MLVGLNGLLCMPQAMADVIGMVTGSKAGTYFEFGQEIATLAGKAGVAILVKESEGSIDNLRRLASSENAAFGIVQSDVLGFVNRMNDQETRHLAARLRLIFPFYNEEVHLLARKEIQRFEDLAGKRVVVGTRGSGNWLTSNNLLLMVNVRPAERIELSPPEAFIAVLQGRADAMFYVAGKPVKLFTTLGELQKDPEYDRLGQGIHFVPLTHERMLREYVASTIGSDDYAWVETMIPTVAVKAVLVSFDFSAKNTPYYRQRCQQLSILGKEIRANFPELQRTGHPKWKEVNLNEELGIWKRDTCSQLRPRGGEIEKEDDLLKALKEGLRGKGQAR